MSDENERLEQRVAQLGLALSQAIGATTEAYVQCRDLTAQVEVLKRLLAEEIAKRREQAAMTVVDGVILQIVLVYWLASVPVEEARAIATMITHELTNEGDPAEISDEERATQASAARLGELRLHRVLSAANDLRAVRQGVRTGSAGGGKLQ